MLTEQAVSKIVVARFVERRGIEGYKITWPEV